LNTPFRRRVRQLQMALERWRWLPHEFARPPIVVNVPEFRLHALDASSHSALEMNVVVGRAFRHQTPVFAGQMHYLIFRPYWHVPPSIQRAELAPKILRDPSYLAKNGYEVVNRNGEVVSGAPPVELRSLKLSIRQLPGPGNALGLVKFVFPNEHEVYLHSTPSQALFSKARRDFSHGCIRVEKPDVLAAWVLRDQPQWTLEHTRQAMNGTQTRRVNLSAPIPVLIVYATAMVQENGEVCFFQDIYGHDASLERLLDKGYPYPY
jgi:L,D-transpeptidase YcbB